MRWVVGLLIAAAPLWSEVNARDLVRQSITNGERSWKLSRTYACVERDEERKLDAGGRVKSKDIDVYEVVPIEGSPYQRLVKHNGRPLSAEMQKKEDQKFKKALAMRKRESKAQRDKRLADDRKERVFLKEVPDAFDFKITGEEQLPTGPAYVIEATPHPGYRPKSRYARAFIKMKGKLWIDKKDTQWVKADAEVMDTISFGWFFARLAKGSHIVLQQTRLNDGVWVPSHLQAKASARIMLVKNNRFEEDITWENYHKPKSEPGAVSAANTR